MSTYGVTTSADFSDVQNAVCGSLLNALATFLPSVIPACKLLYLYEGSVYAVANLEFEKDALRVVGISPGSASFFEQIRAAVDAYIDPQQNTQFQAPVSVRGNAPKKQAGLVLAMMGLLTVFLIDIQ
ncbi:hypothetical protein CRM22_002543 [Opisthorchis felineus]|uniref:Uncharacterized protein n=1 Tax=Opisthorchis felineus TaxID=147828 RepID=A0A4S2M5K6_OPIFE|nr:hypothetical protein CRM22_002543 [Opisthorchis felineus]